MNHTTTAREVARATGWDLDAEAEEMGWGAVGLGPVGRHRDSDSLENSNWEVVTANLLGRFPESFYVHSFRHFAVGWVEELAHDAEHQGATAAVAEWRQALEDYPIADEDHFSALEWEDNHPDADDYCYAPDGPEYCGCGRNPA